MLVLSPKMLQNSQQFIPLPTKNSSIHLCLFIISWKTSSPNIFLYCMVLRMMLKKECFSKGLDIPYFFFGGGGGRPCILVYVFNLPWQPEQWGNSHCSPVRPVAHAGGSPHKFSGHLHSQSIHTASAPSSQSGHTSRGHIQPSDPKVDVSQFLQVHGL